MAWFNRSVVTLAVCACLSASPALAKGQFNVLAKFVNADTEVEVATFSEINDQGVEERVALLGIRNGERRNSVAFEGSDWSKLIALWHQALNSQSDKWHYIGDFTETGTSDVSHLEVSAGPGVRFIVQSPAKGAFTSDLMPINNDQFAAALNSAEDFIDAGKK